MSQLTRYCLYLLVLSVTLTSNATKNDSIRQYSIPASYIASGATFLTIGSIGRYTSAEWTPTQYKAEKRHVVDFVQYVPAAFPWVLKACGAETRSGWGRMATSHAASAAIMAGSVYLAKGNIATLRPDASDYRSFPSGHTAWAYMGATMVSREFGWQSPWYTFGAYSLASAIALQRIVDCRHNPSDVAAGAAVGILASELGYYIGDLIFGSHQINNINHSAQLFNNNTHIALYNTFGIPLTDYNMGNSTISINSFWETSIGAYIALNDSWGFNTNLSARAATVFGTFDNTHTYIAPLNSIGLTAAMSYTKPISNHWAISGAVGGGYYQNFTLKSIDNAISAGNGFIVGNAASRITFAATEQINLSAQVGYELSQQKFSINTNEIYNITTSQSLSKISHALTLGLSIHATL